MTDFTPNILCHFCPHPSPIVISQVVVVCVAIMHLTVILMGSVHISLTLMLIL